MIPRLIYFLSVLIFMGYSTVAASESKSEETMESLVDRSYWAVQRIESAHKKLTGILRAKPRPKDVENQLEDCRRTLREARGQLDEFIAKIKVGESIFTYPGLISLGRIRYITSADTQKELRGTYYLEILIGYSDTANGGSESRIYEVHFDRNGSILDHRVMPRMTE